MAPQEKLNLFLLVTNLNFAILSAFLIISAIVYIIWQARMQHLSWRQWLWKIPLGIAVAMCLVFENFGNLIVRVTVALWRRMGGDDPFDYGQMVSIGAGSIIGLLALLALIRKLSQPRFGERMWLAALALMAVNTAATVYLFFPD
jgi:hypothetical protein